MRTGLSGDYASANNLRDFSPPCPLPAGLGPLSAEPHREYPPYSSPDFPAIENALAPRRVYLLVLIEAPTSVFTMINRTLTRAGGILVPAARFFVMIKRFLVVIKRALIAAIRLPITIKRLPIAAIRLLVMAVRLLAVIKKLLLMRTKNFVIVRGVHERGERREYTIPASVLAAGSLC
jgi:hypothetical protein